MVAAASCHHNLGQLLADTVRQAEAVWHAHAACAAYEAAMAAAPAADEAEARTQLTMNRLEALTLLGNSHSEDGQTRKLQDRRRLRNEACTAYTKGLTLVHAAEQEGRFSSARADKWRAELLDNKDSELSELVRQPPAAAAAAADTAEARRRVRGASRNRAAPRTLREPRPHPTRGGVAGGAAGGALAAGAGGGAGAAVGDGAGARRARRARRAGRRRRRACGGGARRARGREAEERKEERREERREAAEAKEAKRRERGAEEARLEEEEERREKRREAKRREGEEAPP